MATSKQRRTAKKPSDVPKKKRATRKKATPVEVEVEAPKAKIRRGKKKKVEAKPGKEKPEVKYLGIWSVEGDEPTDEDLEIPPPTEPLPDPLEPRKLFRWRKMKKLGWNGKPGFYQCADPALTYIDFPLGLVVDPMGSGVEMRGPLKSYAKLLPKKGTMPLENMFKVKRSEKFILAYAKRNKGVKPLGTEYFSVFSDGKFLYAESFGADGQTPISLQKK